MGGAGAETGMGGRGWVEVGVVRAWLGGPEVAPGRAAPGTAHGLPRTYDHGGGPGQHGEEREEHDLVGVQEVLEEGGSVCDGQKGDLLTAAECSALTPVMGRVRGGRPA